MIEQVAIFLPNGEKIGEAHVGAEGVKKIFFDRENPGCLIITKEENIERYHGYLYIVLANYKKEIEA